MGLTVFIGFGVIDCRFRADYLGMLSEVFCTLLGASGFLYGCRLFGYLETGEQRLSALMSGFCD